MVSDVRGIQCFTGTYEGTPMSVMASGMGLPSLSIYATELYRFYGVERIVRVGTAGGISTAVQVRDVVIASAAHTNSSVPSLMVPGVTVALAPDPYLLRGAMNTAESLEGVRYHVGPVFASDHFYGGHPDSMGKLIELQTLAVEMEAAGLYAVALHGAQAGADRADRLGPPGHTGRRPHQRGARELLPVHGEDRRGSAARLTTGQARSQSHCGSEGWLDTPSARRLTR